MQEADNEWVMEMRSGLNPYLLGDLIHMVRCYLSLPFRRLTSARLTALIESESVSVGISKMAYHPIWETWILVGTADKCHYKDRLLLLLWSGDSVCRRLAGHLNSHVSVDGPITMARFVDIQNVVVDPCSGDVFLLDHYSVRIIRDQQVSTIGYDRANTYDLICLDGNLYVSQSGHGILCLQRSDNGYVQRRISFGWVESSCWTLTTDGTELFCSDFDPIDRVRFSAGRVKIDRIHLQNKVETRQMKFIRHFAGNRFLGGGYHEGPCIIDLHPDSYYYSSTPIQDPALTHTVIDDYSCLCIKGNDAYLCTDSQGIVLFHIF